MEFVCAALLFLPATIMAIVALRAANTAVSQTEAMREQLRNLTAIVRQLLAQSAGTPPPSDETEPLDELIEVDAADAEASDAADSREEPLYAEPGPPAMPAAPTADADALREASPAGVVEDDGWDDVDDGAEADAFVPDGEPARTATVSLEERLGARGLVWIGAFALFLAGAFLVKYTFDAGLMTPTMRVGLGALLGGGLIGVGEWLRRSAARVAQGCCAAGVAILYASFLAASRLYDLIPPSVCFIAMAANTALAIFLSLRHGPFVALLGLVGGYLTPALIGSDERQPGVLFSYLFLLLSGMLIIARRKAWWWHVILAYFGALAWAAVWLTIMPGAGGSAWLGSFLLLSVIAFAWATGGVEVRGAPGLTRYVSVAGVGVGALVMAGYVNVAAYSNLEWLFFGLLAVGSLALARVQPRSEPLAWATAAITGALLATWGMRHAPADATRFAWYVFGFGVLYAGAGYAALWGAVRPWRWATLSGAAGLGALLIAYRSLSEPPLFFSWGGVAACMAAAYTLACVPLYRWRAARPTLEGALEALVIAASALTALAIPLEFRREWLSVAWALHALLLAFLAGWLRLSVAPKLAALLAVICTVWLYQPGVLDFPLGDRPIVNWILWGYGVPCAALAVAAWRLRNESAIVVRTLESAAVLLGFALVTLEVRHFFQGPDLVGLAPNLRELATYAALWPLGALLVYRLADSGAHVALRVAANALLVLSAVAVLVIVGAWSPLLRAADLGTTPILNWLLYAYGVPGVVFALIAWHSRGPDGVHWRNAATLLAAALGFKLVSMEVRHAFHPENVRVADCGLPEVATYVIVWLCGAIAVRWAADRWERGVLRGTSRALVVVALIAVFLTLSARNPLFEKEWIGDWPVINWLLFAYGAPALLLALHSTQLRGGAPDPQWRQALAPVALLLVFALVTLETRRYFHHPILTGPAPTSAEWYAYSAVWIGLGIVLLIAGVRTGGLTLRWASLVVMLAAIGKVFLFDTAQLRDLYRVASLLGLGVSLMALAFIYQKYVFRREGPREQG